MKKLKYIFWFILVLFFVVVVFQNMTFFSTKNSLHVNLGFYENSTPALTNGAIIAIFVGISVLIMLTLYFSSRFDSYRARKIIKKLSAGAEESATTIAALQQEVEQLKGASAEALPVMTGDEAVDQDGGDNVLETETPPTTRA